METYTGQAWPPGVQGGDAGTSLREQPRGLDQAGAMEMERNRRGILDANTRDLGSKSRQFNWAGAVRRAFWWR